MQQTEQRIIRYPELREKLGKISRSTIDRWVKDGTFPPKIKLGTNAMGWSAQLVDQWIADKLNVNEEGKQ